MLDKGKELDWFASSAITTMAVVAVVSFVFFIIWELTAEHPVIDLTLFKYRNFTSGVITISVGYGLFFGTVVLLPLWMQSTLGDRQSTRLNSSHSCASRMPSSA